MTPPLGDTILEREFQFIHDYMLSTIFSHASLYIYIHTYTRTHILMLDICFGFSLSGLHRSFLSEVDVGPDVVLVNVDKNEVAVVI